MIQNLKKSKAGFTLVELIVVIAILGVLAAVLVPQYVQYIESSRMSVDDSMLNEMAHVMQLTAASEETVNKTAYFVVVTDTAITVYSGTAAVPANVKAAGDKMYDALYAAFPDQSNMFKSKTYTTKNVAIDTTGKTSIT